MDEEFKKELEKLSMGFENKILHYVSEKKMSYVDAILEYCKEYELEPEYIKNLITPALKEKLEIEFRDVNLLPKIENELKFI